MEMNGAMAVRCLNLVADTIHAQRQYLTDLDSAIGDADHGINMDRGFTTVRAKLEGLTEKNIGAILKLVGSTLVSTVGGASGPLYGTAFLRAGIALDGKETVTLEDVCAAMDAAVNGIMQRGKATTGEKTMLDALVPAQQALQKALDSGATIPAALKLAADAADVGVQATIPMMATKGRASYLGERSIGHPDPGATSSALLLRTVANALAG